MRRLLLALSLPLAVGCDFSAPSLDVSSTSQEIIGGIVDPGHEYVVGVGDSNGIFCSGTVISRRTVITAGHCFGGITRVFFGTTGNQSANVLQEVRHPNFSNSTLANDMTLLRLASDAPVQPAPLLRETMDNSANFIGPDFTFVGYGLTETNGFGTRRVVNFPIAAVGPANVGGSVGSINNTQFYYRVPGENTCNGDSGGPAFAVRGGVERHAGVTSFGDGPCTLDGVDARTDVPAIQNFIQPTINQFEGATDPCRSNGVCSEACNTNGKIVDPDCAENHCDQDGICAIACVLPMDPDCRSNGLNQCTHNGVCDPLCTQLDQDCAGLCGAEGTCVTACAQPDPDCSGGGGGNPGVCGDGVTNTGEQCDDGNTNNGDDCLNNCKTARCGDGIIHGGFEQCDDANTFNNDACLVGCIAATCGDGFVRTNVEQCDDDNNANGDGCSSTCTLENGGGPVCGNGILEPGEVCDDGNGNNQDGCRTNCVLPFCGDGLVDAGEQCDDGNAILTDACLACELAACGDGIVEDGAEICDDGNTLDGDGCSSACVREGGDEQLSSGCAVSPEGTSLAPFALLGLVALLIQRRRKNPLA